MTRSEDEKEEHLVGRQQIWVERQDRVEPDWITVEEPLEIRVNGKPLAVTLRTPGADRDLAMGFLFTEGVIKNRDQIEAVELGDDPSRPVSEHTIGVLLRQDVELDRERLQQAQRDFLSAAGCGLCGKASLRDVYQRLPTLRTMAVDWQLVQTLPERMRDAQILFATTGGLHAAALFNRAGELLALREDIGRHNAVDKLIGHFLLADALPLADSILVVSARAGFEIVQKALMASIPIVVAVGASSSLAVQLAKSRGMELYSFVNHGRGNRHL